MGAWPAYRAKLASRFSTIRSTLAASARTWTGSSSRLTGVGAEQLVAGLGDHAGDQPVQVDPLAPQLDDAPVQLVEVEQAGDDAVQLAGVGDEPAEEIVGVGLGQPARPREG